jgi:hypothetical protein
VRTQEARVCMGSREREIYGLVCRCGGVYPHEGLQPHRTPQPIPDHAMVREDDSP